MNGNQNQEAGEMVGGVPHHLLDGYDGGSAPPPEFIQQLLASAPPEVKARAAEYAKQMGQQQGGADEGAAQEAEPAAKETPEPVAG